MKRILLSGYYGFGNAGDEAVLAGLIQGLRGRMSPDELAITALSINPTETARTHGITSAHRYEDLLGPIMRCDLFASGGGSLLQDVTSAHGIFYYLAVVRLAQMLGRKTMFIAQGIGPLTRARSQKLTASVANRLDAITVRDPASAALLRDVGVTRAITVTSDPALLLSPQVSRLPDEAIGISLRPWQDQTDRISAALADAYRSALPGIPCVLLNLHGAADASVTGEFLARMTLGAHYDGSGEILSLAVEAAATEHYRELLQSIAGCQMVIGMRLHALIFATAGGVPSVALAYDPKINAFMEQTGQADAVYDIRENDATGLTALIARVWSERGARAERLAERLPGLREAALLNTDSAISLINR